MNQNGGYVLKMDLRHYFTSEREYRLFLLKMRLMKLQGIEPFGGLLQSSKRKNFNITSRKNRGIMAPAFNEHLKCLRRKGAVNYAGSNAKRR